MNNVIIDYSLLYPDIGIYKNDIEKAMDGLYLLYEVLERVDNEEIKLFWDVNYVGNIFECFPFNFMSNDSRIQDFMKPFMRVMDSVIKKMSSFEYKNSDDITIDKTNLILNNSITNEKNITGICNDLGYAWSNDNIDIYVTLNNVTEVLKITHNEVLRIVKVTNDYKQVEEDFSVPYRSFTHNSKHDTEECISVLIRNLKCSNREELLALKDLGKEINKNKYRSPLMCSAEFCSHVINRAISINDEEPLFFSSVDGQTIPYLLFRNNGKGKVDYHAYSEFYIENIPLKVRQYYDNRVKCD